MTQLSRRTLAALMLVVCLGAHDQRHAFAYESLAQFEVKFVIDGTIAAVTDGDTLSLQTSAGKHAKIRLSDFDAPEIAHEHNPHHDSGGQRRRHCRGAPLQARGQSGGEAATAALRGLAPRAAPAQARCYEQDSYGRFVCHVFVRGVNLNLEQIRHGWGMTATKAQWIRDPASKRAEQAAREAHVGIWSQAAPVLPATWRDRCWCHGHCQPTAP